MKTSQRIFRGPLLWFLVLGFALYATFSLVQRAAEPQPLTFSEFLQAAEDGRLEGQDLSKVTIGNRSEVISGEMRDPDNPSATVPFQTTYNAQVNDDQIAQLITEGKIDGDFDAEQTGALVSFLFQMLPFVLIFLLFFFLMQQMQGGGGRVMQFGKSKAKLVSKDSPKVTFSDVAGADEAIEELREIKEFLENPAKFQSMGAKIPKGVLLYGPPGTGKTLLARAVAGEAGVPFFSISGSDFVEMFVGVGASVTGDTPVLVRDADGTRLVPIAEVVDAHYDDGADDFVVSVDGLETLGYTPRTSGFRGDISGFGGSAWSDVSGVYRHRVDEILEIEFLGGTIRTTGDHSVFVRSHGGIKAVAASELAPGDVLVDLPYKTRGGFIPGRGTQHELRAHDFSEALPPTRVQVWAPDPEAEAALARARGHDGPAAPLAEELGVSPATVNNWRAGRHEPRGSSDRYDRTPVPQAVDVDEDLLTVLGYYTAEGRVNSAVDFTFGSHEHELIEDCTKRMRAVFDLDPAIAHTDDNATRLQYRSAALGRFFERQCGTGSGNKHVPELLWDAPRELFLAYLRGWSDGDGYTDDRGRLIVTSVSQQLVREMAWLAGMHGMKAGVRHGVQQGGRVIRTKPLPDGEYWTLILGRTSNPFSGRPSTNQHKKPVIREIRRVPFEGYVYDLVGCTNEAFFGGERPVLLHNSRVRDLFEQAKANAPAIIFMDEIDAVGRHRGAGLGGGHDEREQTLNQLLVEMDGFDVRTTVILIAATNRPDILDPALLRPGRFDRQITVDRPDLVGREAILKIHTRGKPLAEDIDINALARQTPGFTGADLANLVNEAALLAARFGKKEITQDELAEAIDRVIAGPERKSRIMSERERRITAYHESGHAIVGHALPHVDPIHKVTIIPRGRAGGYTLALPVEDKSYATRGELMDQIAFAMGGRVAEELKVGDYTTGASNDIQKATGTARKMITEYGMSAKLGPIKLGHSDSQPFLGREFGHEPDYSDEVAMQIDLEVRALIDEAHDEALEILVENDDILELMANRLLEEETLDTKTLEEILKPVTVRPSRAFAAPIGKSPTAVLNSLRRLNGSSNGNGSASGTTRKKKATAKKSTTKRATTKKRD